MKQIKAVLTIEVLYNVNDEDIYTKHDIKLRLNNAAEHLIDNGLLTGESSDEVKSCTHEVVVD